MTNSIEITLLSEDEIWNSDKKLDIMKRISCIADITDLALLTNGYSHEVSVYGGKKNHFLSSNNKRFKGVTGMYYTRSRSKSNDESCYAVSDEGEKKTLFIESDEGVIRPMLKITSDIFQHITGDKVNSYYREVYEIKFGEYPQFVPNLDLQQVLENEYQR